MRRITFVLLLFFAFSVPWEYSLDLGGPFGNIARLAGLGVLFAAVPAILLDGRLRSTGPIQILVLTLYLWLCCTYFWSIDPSITLDHLRGNFQEMMIVWLLWEFIDTPQDLHLLLAAYLAGSGLLAVLTFTNFASVNAIASRQIRFVAEGQDPNDAARLLALAFPLAILLFHAARNWPVRLVAMAYLPVALLALFLTGSRGGFLGALVALTASAFLLIHNRSRIARASALALPALIASLWFAVPRETINRLATIPSLLQAGDLNQRWNIWDAGWHAFLRSPWIGSGIGAFTTAAATNPLDTAHNTPLSILVGGGLVALFLAMSLLALALTEILPVPGLLKGALLTALLVVCIGSLVGTIEENRATWLLLGIVAVSGRLAFEFPQELNARFSPVPVRRSAEIPSLPAVPAD